MGAGTASAVAGTRIELTTLGVVAALPGEARILAGKKCRPRASLRLPGDVHLRLSGMGPVAAQTTAQALVDDGARALVSWGCAGGLCEDLAAGSLLLPLRVVTEQGEDFPVDAQWHARLAGVLYDDYETGALCSSAQPVSSVAAKRRLREHTQARAVDMESAAVAAVARVNKVPFLVVRAVSDTADTAVPEAALRALSQAGDLQVLAMMTSLFKAPAQIPALLELSRCFGRAQASLRGVVTAAGTRLGAA